MFYKIYEIIYSEILLNKITSPLVALEPESALYWGLKLYWGDAGLRRLLPAFGLVGVHRRARRVSLPDSRNNSTPDIPNPEGATAVSAGQFGGGSISGSYACIELLFGRKGDVALTLVSSFSILWILRMTSSIVSSRLWAEAAVKGDCPEECEDARDVLDWRDQDNFDAFEDPTDWLMPQLSTSWASRMAIRFNWLISVNDIVVFWCFAVACLFRVFWRGTFHTNEGFPAPMDVASIQLR